MYPALLITLEESYMCPNSAETSAARMSWIERGVSWIGGNHTLGGPLGGVTSCSPQVIAPTCSLWPCSLADELILCRNIFPSRLLF
ncbi:hypothetical protein CEXT_528261 [Caerostris extrusa]|uniref:Uncharacterized protein n=1 Tax=Caerostris extrusa TaxID=172846 RepID=A0AAV4PBA9_CAEEX|nr:hypothetical protein CEXT_528261 [Caerostris extrusa]